MRSAVKCGQSVPSLASLRIRKRITDGRHGNGSMTILIPCLLFFYKESPALLHQRPRKEVSIAKHGRPGNLMIDQANRVCCLYRGIASQGYFQCADQLSACRLLNASADIALRRCPCRCRCQQNPTSSARPLRSSL